MLMLLPPSALDAVIVHALVGCSAGIAEGHSAGGWGGAELERRRSRRFEQRLPLLIELPGPFGRSGHAAVRHTATIAERELSWGVLR